MTSELAKLAARQEMLRRRLQELQEEGEKGDDGKGPGGDLLKEIEEDMKQTEEDILNNNITQKTLERQEKMITRLLEAENASKEQDYSNERKAEAADSTNYSNQAAEFEEYIRLKEKQIELLQTIPPNLTPYYKHEVNEYFENLEKN